METILHHQNTMRALRREMGWPPFSPANDAIAFCSGRTMNAENGIELARVAQMLGKDIIHSEWANSKVPEPTGFTVAYRTMYSIDIIDRLVPFAANDDAPLVLVSTTGNECFAIDQRGSLMRLQGKPKGVHKGHRLAMKRIKSVAAGLGDEILANNRFVKPGEVIEPEVPSEIVVRFG